MTLVFVLIFVVMRVYYTLLAANLHLSVEQFSTRLRVCYALGRYARTRIMRVITCKVRNIIEKTVHFRAFRQIWSKKVVVGGGKIFISGGTEIGL